MSGLDIHNQPLHKLHKQRLAGEISTVEITEHILDRIKKLDNQVKSFIVTYPEEAHQAAQKADDKIKKGEPVDLIEGMPLAIKDIFNVEGTITTCGSKILENYRSPYDATVVKNLKRHNFSLVGKTNLDEFAMGSNNENSAFFKSYNPYNLDCVPGGSSGGSAAAVAAGFCLGALGTDTGGSIRQPASFCGVVGIKPTYGLVSRYGIAAYGSSLDQAGTLASNVKDATLLLQRIAGYDEHDPTSIKLPVADLSTNFDQDITGLKIGVIDNLDLSSCSKEVRENFQQTLKLLSDKGKVEIKKINIPIIEHATATYYIIAMAEASSNLGRYDGIRYGFRAESENLTELYKKSRELGFGDEAKFRILLGTFVLSAGYYDAYYKKAQKVQILLRKQFKQAFNQVDAVITPVAPTTAFKVGENITDPLKIYLTDAFTVPANLTGIPGMSLPAGVGNNNLPIGIQLLADHGKDGTLVKVGDWLERNIEGPTANLAI
ncbi:MAG: Asp-tRNA(Asn)/Glu-tRNA(Gln) amidotransferase subunit GatA [SAR324 cluster bacterium]|nr:Asp-tRNA(Asn)/Glu-tRNA(Gln) amidotransferase subunit GatA [SAR324 cluster bacterium]